MDSGEIEKRFTDIEARLAGIESLIPKTSAPPPAQPVRPDAAKAPSTKPQRDDRPSLVTSILGWGGAVALVLAAAYLIRLAVESGWLTPVRQVAFAAILGFVMIVAGFFLRNKYRHYAGLLPAGGVVILFLSIYGAHLFYGFMQATPAAVGIVFVCLLSLWLCTAFAGDLYALFAVAGSYSAPLLIAGAMSEAKKASILVVMKAFFSLVLFRKSSKNRGTAAAASSALSMVRYTASPASCSLLSLRLTSCRCFRFSIPK